MTLVILTALWSHNVRVGVFTDIGSPCAHVRKYFSDCHAAFLESNYDEWMLDNGPYPYPLKQRIRGTHGHLSNTDAMKLFLEHRSEHMRYLFLSHLSAENNHPKIVDRIFSKIAGETHVIIAPRNRETKLVHVTSNPIKRLSGRPVKYVADVQLALFQ
jgi:phosphoribosyl 1,2-cyclic phosphodiesterase